MKAPYVPTNPIGVWTGAPDAGAWVSENEAAQSSAAAAAARHETDAAPAAGISTRPAGAGSEHYFVWSPAAGAGAASPSPTSSSPAGVGVRGKFYFIFAAWACVSCS